MPPHLHVLLIMKGLVDTVSIPVPLQLGHLVVGSHIITIIQIDSQDRKD